MNVSSAASTVAGYDERGDPALDARRPIAGGGAADLPAGARSPRARRTLVDDQPRDARRQQRCPQCTAPAVGVANDVDGRARPIGHRVGDRGQVLVLALDRVRRPIAGGASASPVDGMQTESALEHRSDGSPRSVIGRRAVNEQERRSLTGGEDRDRRPVGRYDDPLNGRHGRQR